MAHNRLSMHATTIAPDGTDTVVTYHATQIVRFDAKRVILNSGGWQGVTTKRKMNQAALQFGLGYYVCQRDFDWFVGKRAANGAVILTCDEIPFVDGMELAR